MKHRAPLTLSGIPRVNLNGEGDGLAGCLDPTQLLYFIYSLLSLQG